MYASPGISPCSRGYTPNQDNNYIALTHSRTLSPPLYILTWLHRMCSRIGLHNMYIFVVIPLLGLSAFSLQLYVCWGCAPQNKAETFLPLHRASIGEGRNRLARQSFRGAHPLSRPLYSGSSRAILIDGAGIHSVKLTIHHHFCICRYHLYIRIVVVFRRIMSVVLLICHCKHCVRMYGCLIFN